MSTHSALIPLPKGYGKVSWKKSSRRPLLLLFKGLLGESNAGELRLNPRELEEVGWFEIRRIGVVVDHLDLPGRHPVSHQSGGVHWGIFPKEPPVHSHHWPLLLENFQELAQGIHDVVGVHRCPPGHVVGADEALGVEEGQDHLLAPAGLHLGLGGASWPFRSFLCCLIWGVWKDTTDLSKVTAWSSIAMKGHFFTFLGQQKRKNGLKYRKMPFLIYS